MNDQVRPDSADVIDVHDAERLLGGELPEVDDSPLFDELVALLTSARRNGEPAELVPPDDVVAAFRAARTSARKSARRPARLGVTVRRTIAIVGIATCGSVGTAVATGAIDTPFTVAPWIHHRLRPAPPIESPEPAHDIADELSASETTPARATPAVAFDVEPIPTPQSTTQPSEHTLVPRETSIDATDPMRSITAEQTTPSATSPGQTNDNAPATPPGQTNDNAPATPPGQTNDNAPATPPGQTNDNNPATPPGQTNDNNPATPPGQTNDNNPATPPGHTNDNNPATPPGQTNDNNPATPPGQTNDNNPATPPGQTNDNNPATPPGQTNDNNPATPPGLDKN